jgi:predicted enzyme related to lactoylglutathione lyase
MNGICHVEIPCKDFEKIRKFYGDVFGWETQTMAEMDYAMFKAPEGPGGGFSKQAKIAPEAGVFIYIEVGDMDATLKKIETAGGKMVQPKTQISPDFGYYAVFHDIEGNMIGLWSKN